MVEHQKAQATTSAGFTYVEVLVAGALLAFTLLGVCTMFVAGYANITGAGRSTMGLSATKQLMESVRQLPFDSLPNLDGFDSDDVSSLPAADPEREIVRRWRYALGGEGVGWTFSDTEKARWTNLAAQGDSLGAIGTISITPQGADLAQVTVTVSVPGSWRNVQLTTLLARF